jgi:hypothetical protein
MNKLMGITIAVLFFALFLFQVQGVLAGKDNNNSPLTSSITPTPPVTGPSLCKPGYGYGDKNHCHSGPKGLENN